MRLKIVSTTGGFWDFVKCPFCQETFCENGLVPHVQYRAKREPYENMMGIKKGLKHAIFFKRHTKLVKINYNERVWKITK